MATADELIIKIRADMRDIKRKLDDLQRESGQTARTMQHRFTRAAQSINSAFRSIRVPAFAAISAGIALSVRESARAEEIGSRFNAVFRGIEDDTRAWATTTAEATARSSIALEQYLSTFQDTFVPLGLAREEAAGFSQTLTQLAIDLASFNNESEPETVQALQSAIVGNHETVRRYGVIINQAALDQELLNMGIRGGTQEATAAQAAMARLNLIIAGTADAQGDAARTSDSATNQYRAFTAELRDAAVAIGDSFMPVAQELMTWARDVVPFLEQVGVALGNITVAAINPYAEVSTEELEATLDRLQDERDSLTSLGGGMGRGGQFALSSIMQQQAPIVAELNRRRDEAAMKALQHYYDAVTDVINGWIPEETENPKLEYERLLNRPPPTPSGPIGDSSAIAENTAFLDRMAEALEDVSVEAAEAAQELKLLEAGGKVSLQSVAEEAEEAAKAIAEDFAEAFERIGDGALKNLEDSFVQFVRTGRFQITSLVNYIIEQFARLAFQNTIGNALDSVFATIISAVVGGPAAAAASIASGVSGKVASAAAMPVAAAGITETVASAPALQVAAAGSQARSMTVASGRAVTVSQPITIDARGADAGVEDRIRRIFADQGPALQQQTIRATIEAIGRINGAGRVQN